MRTSVAAGLSLIALAVCARAGGEHSRIAQSAGVTRQCYGGITVDDRTDCYRAVILDGDTGKANAVLRFDGPVLAAVADGKGGWYVGGGFKHVNGQLRKRLAHLDSAGRLDRNWHPEANGNGVVVRALALGVDRVYASGDFAFVNHQPRIGLAAFDARTGGLDQRWRHSGHADALAFGAGHVIAAGGDDVVALDARTGRPRWHALVAANFEGGGVKLIATAAKRIYVAGIFSGVAGIPRHGLAALALASGRFDRAWKPPRWTERYCPPCNGVTALAASSRLYVGRSLDPNGVIHALDLRTGAVDRRWRANLRGVFGEPTTLSVLAVLGRRVYAGGTFRQIQGSVRHGFAALDDRTAAVLPAWKPSANSVAITATAPSRDQVLVSGLVTNAVTFTFSRFRAYRPFSRGRQHLRIGATLSGPGTLRIDLGRSAPHRRCLLANCPGTVVATRTLTLNRGERGLVSFRVAALPPGRYFVRFTPRGRGGPPQPPLTFAFKLRP